MAATTTSRGRNVLLIPGERKAHLSARRADLACDRDDQLLARNQGAALKPIELCQGLHHRTRITIGLQ